VQHEEEKQSVPAQDKDLDTMRSHHERLGVIPPERGFYAWWRRFFGRQGRGV
jgi:hypothetical protein